MVDVVFRTDASLQIGTGHVMRCLTLAQALRRRGANCRFITRPHPGHMMDQIHAAGFDVLPLPAAEARAAVEDMQGSYASWLGADSVTDSRQVFSIFPDQPAEWLVVDHYGIDARWESSMREACQRLLVIDDLADRPHDCQMLLDQTLNRKPADYEGLLPAGCEVLAGSRVALLRPEFAAERPASLQRHRSGHIKRLLITMGGVDLHDMTSRVLAALVNCDLAADIQVDVVMGIHAPWQDKVREAIRRLPFAARVHVGIDAMAKLMASCDLAVGAAGTTALERCCLGLPTIALVLAPNQMEGAQALQAAGAIVSINDNDRLEQSLAAAWQSVNRSGVLGQMSAAAAALCDGRGADIVADRMMHG